MVDKYPYKLSHTLCGDETYIKVRGIKTTVELLPGHAHTLNHHELPLTGQDNSHHQVDKVKHTYQHDDHTDGITWGGTLRTACHYLTGSHQ